MAGQTAGLMGPNLLHFGLTRIGRTMEQYLGVSLPAQISPLWMQSSRRRHATLPQTRYIIVRSKLRAARRWSGIARSADYLPQNNQPKPCNPTPAQLANSGAVTFRFSEGGATLLATSGDAFGTFKTAGGYSGTFHVSFDGAFVGSKGFGAAYGTGSSQSLATFKGVNYNLIGTLWTVLDRR